MNCKLDALQKQIDKWGAGPTKNPGDKWWYTPVDFGQGLKNHRIDMTDIEFHHHPAYGLNKWENYISPNLPIPLRNRVVMDIGCNCGLFCVEAARDGAKKVIGIEGDPGDNGFYDQSQLVLDILCETEGVDYREKVSITNSSAEKFSWDACGEIDIAFAFNVFYWMDDPRYVVNKLSEKAVYLFILGQEDNKRKYASLEDIQYLLEGKFDIIKQFIPEVPGGREFNATIARSVLYKDQ